MVLNSAEREEGEAPLSSLIARELLVSGDPGGGKRLDFLMIEKLTVKREGRVERENTREALEGVESQ